MDNLKEIQEKLDAIYDEYKQNKYKLNAEKTKEAAQLLAGLTFDNDASISDIASRLSMFPADTAKFYFETIAKNESADIELLDEVMEELLKSVKKANKPQTYLQKLVSAASAIMKNCKDKALTSVQLPQFVVYAANCAAKTKSYGEKFRSLADSTKGRIFALDYSAFERSALFNVWNAAIAYSSNEYKAAVIEWGNKYGFETAKYAANQTVTDLTNGKTATDEKTAPISDKKAENISSANDMTLKELYASLKEDIAKEKDAVIKAVESVIAPMQNEINKYRFAKADEQSAEIQAVKQSLASAEAENAELKKQIEALEAKNAELDKSLNNAYEINRHEIAFEANKLRSELKRNFSLLYEDWLEYENSDVNEINYESLQAIIKKVFRALDRNGIDYKGNNK